MPATPNTPRELSPEEQEIAAELGEISGAGMVVMRNTRRLAEIEAATIEALAQAAAVANQDILDPQSLEAARRAGQDFDNCKAALAEAVAGNATLANTYDKVARALRRAIALRLHLLSGRPFRPLPPLTPAPGPGPDPGRPPTPPRAPRDPDLDPPERLYDAPDTLETDRLEIDGLETGDELGAVTTGKALQAIRRELAAAAADPNAGQDPPSAKEPAWDYQPGKTRPFPQLTNPATRPRAPDT